MWNICWMRVTDKQTCRIPVFALCEVLAISIRLSYWILEKKYREDYSNNTQHNKYDDKKYFAPRGTGFESPSTSSSYSNDSYSSPEWSEDDKATIQLVRIEKELRENVDRLAVLQLQPATFESNMEIQLCKQKIVNGFLSAIEVAKSVKDYKLAAEYEIRMNKAVTAMKLMPR